MVSSAQAEQDKYGQGTPWGRQLLPQVAQTKASWKMNLVCDLKRMKLKEAEVREMEVRECQGDEREGPRGRGRHGRRVSGEITKED